MTVTTPSTDRVPVNKRQLGALRANAICSVLTKTDRVLSGSHKLEVKAEKLGYDAPPSCTDGNTILFNTNKINFDVSDANLVSLFGLNYHELAHVLYTPMGRTGVVYDGLNNVARTAGVSFGTVHNVYNALEDQRIERLMTARWPSTIPYFVSAIADHILKQRETQKNASYYILGGRHYLDRSIRRESRSRLINSKGADHVDSVDRIVNEYLQLVLPRDHAALFRLITEFLALLGWDAGNVGTQHDENKRTGASISQKEKEQNQDQDQKQAGEPADDLSENDGTSEDDQEQDDQETADGGASDDQDQDDQDQDSQGSGSGGQPSEDDQGQDDQGSGCQDDLGALADSDDAGEPNDSDASGEDDQGDEGSTQGAGSSSGGQEHRSLADQLRDLKDSVLGDDDFRNELNDKIHKVNNVRDFDPVRAGIPIDNATKNMDTPPPGLPLVTRKITAEFDRLRADADPGWDKYQSSGRLNIGRAMRGDDLDTLFDTWDEGRQDVTDIEAVILIDKSISMEGRMDAVSHGAWVLKRSLDNLGASTTVLTYNTEPSILWPASQTATKGLCPTVKVQGGTQIYSSLEVANAIMAVSQKTHKLVFILTDGEWGDAHLADPLIAGWNSAGIHTALAWIVEKNMVQRFKDYYNSQQDAPKDGWRHNCQTVEVITSGEEMVTVVAKAVKNIMRENGKGR